MLSIDGSVRVYLTPGVTDMRKSIDTLAILVAEQMALRAAGLGRELGATAAVRPARAGAHRAGQGPDQDPRAEKARPQAAAAGGGRPRSGWPRTRRSVGAAALKTASAKR